MKLFVLIFFILASIPCISIPRAEVRIQGEVLFPKTGKIYIKLCSIEEFEVFDGGKFGLVLAVGPQEIEQKKISFSFENVPPGEYAIRCFQDVNGNGKLDMGPFGPKEPAGFYHPSPVKMRAPKFSEVSFEVKEDILALQIELKSPGRMNGK